MRRIFCFTFVMALAYGEQGFATAWDCGNFPNAKAIEKTAAEICPKLRSLNVPPSLVASRRRLEEAFRSGCTENVFAVYHYRRQICDMEALESRELGGFERTISDVQIREPRQAFDHARDVVTPAAASHASIAVRAKAIADRARDLLDRRISDAKNLVDQAFREAGPARSQLGISEKVLIAELDQVRSSFLEDWIQAFKARGEHNLAVSNEYQRQRFQLCEQAGDLGSSGSAGCQQQTEAEFVRQTAEIERRFGGTDTYVHSAAARQAAASPANPPTIQSLEPSDTRNDVNIPSFSLDEADAPPSSYSTPTAEEMNAMVRRSMAKVLIWENDQEIATNGSAVLVETDRERRWLSAEHVFDPSGPGPSSNRYSLLPEAYNEPQRNFGPRWEFMSEEELARARLEGKIPGVSPPQIANFLDPEQPQRDFVAFSPGQIGLVESQGVVPLDIRRTELEPLRPGEVVYITGYPEQANGFIATQRCIFEGYREDFNLQASCSPGQLDNLKGASGGVWTDARGRAIAVHRQGTGLWGGSLEQSRFDSFGEPIYRHPAAESNPPGAARVIRPYPPPPGPLASGTLRENRIDCGLTNKVCLFRYDENGRPSFSVE